MLVCSIKEKKLSTVLEKLKNIRKADYIELRLDGLDSLQIDEIKYLKNQIFSPVIFTLRPKRQLGEYEKSEKERLKTIEQLLALQPDFFDIEYDIEETLLERWKQLFFKTKFIVSFHSLSYPNLENLLKKMQKKSADSYKIAIQPFSYDELSLFYDFAIKHTKNKKLTAIALGEKYTFFRLLRINNFLDYVAANNPVAPGQISYDEAISLYRLLQINKNTKFYALIGHPINRSIGHLFHNQIFQKKGFSCVYVKIPLLKDELFSFMKFVKKTQFFGFSVTSPLKEEVIKYVDEKDQDFPSINTLVKKDGKWKGYNTDVLAIMDLLNNLSLIGKKIAILGGGGAAKAIGTILKNEKAEITFFVRNIKKIQSFTKENGFISFSLREKTEEKFDILINTIPLDKLLIDKEMIHPHMYVIDLVWPKHRQTALITLAKEKKCFVCDALSFFCLQALYQQRIWME